MPRPSSYHRLRRPCANRLRAYSCAGNGALASLATDICGYWTLDETDMNNRLDSSGNGNTLSPAGSNDMHHTAGKVGNAADFWTDHGYLDSSNPADACFRPTNTDFTAAGWVRMAEKPALGVGSDLIGVGALQLAGGDESGWCVLYDQTADRFKMQAATSLSNSVQATAADLGAPSVGTWYFLACWYDASAGEINIQANNGSVNANTGVSAIHYEVGLQYLRFGGLAGGDGLYGYLDEWGFWHRVLTSDERAALYNGGSGVTWPFS